MNSSVPNAKRKIHLKRKRNVYLNHIRRLQEENWMLAQVIADERRLRIAAWRVHWKWCQDTFWNRFRAFLMMLQSEEEARRSFLTAREREARDVA